MESPPPHNQKSNRCAQQLWSVRSTALAIALGVAALGTSSVQDLAVLRTSPSTPADRAAPVVITFDRPVAGGLETTVAAEDFFQISPPVAGTIQWRDPVTMVFEPREILPHETNYTVTLRQGLRAMDGSRLTRPYSFQFRTAGAKILDGFPVGPGRDPNHVDLEPTFTLAFDSPVEPELIVSRTLPHAAPPCSQGVIPLRVVSVRRVEDGDERPMYRIRRPGSQIGTDYRRIVELAPVRPLPAGCRVIMRLPLEVLHHESRSEWSFRARGPLAVTALSCGGQFCPAGPVQITFSNPVRGAEVLRHVQLDPAVEFRG